MNILIIEQPLCNRGDESAHRGLMTKLVQSLPEAKITVLFCRGETAENINEFKFTASNIEYTTIPLIGNIKIWTFRFVKLFMLLNMPALLYTLPLFRNFAKYCKKSDFVVCAPGGINLGGFKDWFHVSLLQIAKMEHKKVFYYGRSIGPFCDDTYTNRLFKKRSLSLLNYFVFTSLRETKSQEIALKLGVSYIPTIDSAFLINPTQNIPTAIEKQLSGTNYIAFVPNSLAWHHNFKDYTFGEITSFWVELLNKLAEEYYEYKFVMLPQTIGYSTNLPDGYKFFNEIKSLSIVNPNRVFVLPEKYGSDIQQAIISKSAFLIGARYHSIIFAINQGVPFISLSYEHKMSGVLEELNKMDCEVNIVNTIAHSSEKQNNSTLIQNIIDLSHQIKPDKKSQRVASKIANDCFLKFKNTLTETVE